MSSDEHCPVAPDHDEPVVVAPRALARPRRRRAVVVEDTGSLLAHLISTNDGVGKYFGPRCYAIQCTSAPSQFSFAFISLCIYIYMDTHIYIYIYI